MLSRSSLFRPQRAVAVLSATPRRPLSVASVTSHPKESAAAFTIGLMAGGLGSLIGLGGSFVSLPLLTGWLKMQQNLAHGTAIATVLCTSLGGTLAYVAAQSSSSGDSSSLSTVWEQVKSKISQGQVPDTIGNVDFVIALSLSAASSISVVKGAQLSKTMTPAALKLTLGCVQLLFSPLILLRDKLKEASTPTNSTLTTTMTTDATPAVPSQPLSIVERSAASFAIGGFSGVLAGMFGVGGGVIQIPALCLFTDIEYHTALGTSLAAMLPVAIVGSAAHLRQGTMIARIAVPLGLGSLVGSFLGGTQAKNVDAEQLKYALPLVMMTLGVQGVYQGLRLLRK